LNIIGQLDDLLIDRRALVSHATIASLNLQFGFIELGPVHTPASACKPGHARVLNYPGTFWSAKKILKKNPNPFKNNFRTICMSVESPTD
jgi:hypothetical protein